jgi:hypothetical protein
MNLIGSFWFSEIGKVHIPKTLKILKLLKAAWASVLPNISDMDTYNRSYGFQDVAVVSGIRNMKESTPQQKKQDISEWHYDCVKVYSSLLYNKPFTQFSSHP